MILRIHRAFKMLLDARRLCRLSEGISSPKLWYQAVSQFPAFAPDQRESEIVGLLHRLMASPPRVLCEIGTAGGGSLFLFSRVAADDALLITVDINFSCTRILALRYFARAQQRITCLRADSHSPETVLAVGRLLRGQQIDVLYIDGDHSYEGVRSDFDSYSSLVRPGGVIVLHDIVPDAHSRGRTATETYTGGVPRFWAELIQQRPSREVFVENWAQDGYGIGLVTVPM